MSGVSRSTSSSSRLHSSHFLFCPLESLEWSSSPIFLSLSLGLLLAEQESIDGGPLAVGDCGVMIGVVVILVIWNRFAEVVLAEGTYTVNTRTITPAGTTSLTFCNKKMNCEGISQKRTRNYLSTTNNGMYHSTLFVSPKRGGIPAESWIFGSQKFDVVE